MTTSLGAVGVDQRASVAPTISQTMGVRTWTKEGVTTRLWNGLRKDPELWFEQGDCQVFLFAKGSSRRGPSFRIPLQALEDADCLPLIAAVEHGGLHSSSGSSSGGDDCTSISSRSSNNDMFSLYLPQPSHSARGEAFQWHIATRNFFAWLFGKSLVGNEIGKALVDVRDRMNVYRTRGAPNASDLMIYAEFLGYSKVANSPDYALGMLYFAEHCQNKDVWTNAFAHCVGMNGISPLSDSSQFDCINPVTKALITRASLQLDLRLDRTARALRTFLDDELSISHFGLSREARSYLDEFRSSIISYAVTKYGWWPPASGSAYPKTLYETLQMDFQDLYDFLVDKRSNEPAQVGATVTEGICVRQHINEFNKRLKHEPLPHALPLLPQFSGVPSPRTSQRALRALGMTKDSKDIKAQQVVSYRSALHEAANRGDQRIGGSSLVQAFVASENEQAARHTSRFSIIEARKARWILIYGVLQTLVSINRPPQEVKDAKSCNYPLCCVTAPSWARPNRTLDRYATSADGKVLPERFANLVLSERRSLANLAIHQNHANAKTFDHSPQLSARTLFPQSDGSEAPTIPRRKSLGRLRAANARLTRASTPNLSFARFTSDLTPIHTSHIYSDSRLPEMNSGGRNYRAPGPRTSLVAQPSMPCIRELVADDPVAGSSMAISQWHLDSEPPSPYSRPRNRCAASPSLGDETASSYSRSSLEYDSESSRYDVESDDSSLNQRQFSPSHKDADSSTNAELIMAENIKSFDFGFERQITEAFLADWTYDCSPTMAM